MPAITEEKYLEYICDQIQRSPTYDPIPPLPFGLTVEQIQSRCHEGQVAAPLDELMRRARDYEYFYGTGLGNVISNGLEALGIKKWEGCGCDKRQAMLNRWVKFRDRAKVVAEWAVAITTTPRYVDPEDHGKGMISYFPTVVRSIVKAGWDQINVFAEPGSPIPDGWEDLLRVHHYSEQMGVHRNYLHTMRTLLERYPAASHLLIVQDDTVLCGEGLRQWLEYNVPAGLTSLFTGPKYSYVQWRSLKHKSPVRDTGWHRLNPGRGMAGACALVWPRALAERFLTNSFVLGWRGNCRTEPRLDEKGNPLLAQNGRVRKRPIRDEHGQKIWHPPHRWQNTDAVIGRWAKNRRNCDGVWYPVPSLADHIADVSSIRHGGRGTHRFANHFVGLECGFDCLNEVFGV